MESLFYENGLRWSCVRCSCCCRYESGYVFLSKNDLNALTRELALPEEQFMQTYCRWIAVSADIELLSLKETSANDCFFWKNGCSVYRVRPSQCRTYPFWKNFLVSENVWKESTASCPGVGQGELHTKEYILHCIETEENEFPLARRL